ncbi:MAG: hypothetical protein AB1801_25435, partial [Chloroflexota bacterium]
MTERTDTPKKLTPFQIIVLVWLGVITLVVGIVVFSLLQARAAVMAAIEQAAAQLEAVANDRIEYTVKINQQVPISTSIAINENISVPIDLTVSHNVAINQQIPISRTIAVPVNLEIDEVFPIDA